MEMKMSEETKTSAGQGKTGNALSCRRFHKGICLLCLSGMLSLSVSGCGSQGEDIGLTGEILYGETRAVYEVESSTAADEMDGSEIETDLDQETKKAFDKNKNGEKKEKETRNNKDASSDQSSKSTQKSGTKKEDGKGDKKSTQKDDQAKDGKNSQKTENKSGSKTDDRKTSVSNDSKQADRSSATAASKDADTSQPSQKAAASTTAAPAKAPEPQPVSGSISNSGSSGNGNAGNGASPQAQQNPAAPAPTQAPTQPAPAPTEAPKPAKPAVTLSGISAAYTGGAKTEGESVSGAEIAVTAQYSDGSSRQVGGWVCGEANKPLSAGSHTFTVTYEGKSSRFTVNVAAKPAPTQAPTEAPAPAPTQPAPEPTEVPTQPAPAPTEAPQPATSQAYIDEFMRGFNQARVDAGLPGNVGINPKWSGYAQYYAEYHAKKWGNTDWVEYSEHSDCIGWMTTNEGIGYHINPYDAGYVQADHVGATRYEDFGSVGVGVYYDSPFYYVCVQQWEDEDYPD